MEHYIGTDVHEGDFVMIASNVQDPDNAKLYMKSSTGYTFITDLSGTEGMKGEKGDKGNKGDRGDPGADGYSPSVYVTEIEGGHRISISTIDGFRTFDVMDGSVNIDDTAGAGDTDVTFSADKLTTEFSGKVSEPSSDGTNGQVLATNGEGGRYWKTVSGGGGGGGSLPSGGQTGDLLAKRSSADDDAEWITPASSVEQDNTRPITSAAVYTEIGNINALLATI